VFVARLHCDSDDGHFKMSRQRGRCQEDGEQAGNPPPTSCREAAQHGRLKIPWGGGRGAAKGGGHFGGHTWGGRSLNATYSSQLKPIHQQYIVRGNQNQLNSPTALYAAWKLCLMLRSTCLLPFAAAAVWNGTSCKPHRRSGNVNINSIKQSRHATT
jgi:hypothetical protein